MLFFLPPMYMFAQLSVSGKVTDENDQPLRGVSITIKGKNGGSTTSDQGRFVINAPGTKSTLVFSSVGFSAQEVQINGRTSVNVQLKSEAAALNDVVVVGYGTLRRSDVTGSITTVKVDEKQAQVTSTIDKFLQGKAAGVDVVSGSGAPGGNINVRIRGTGTATGSSEPLYVVDGIIMNTAGQDVRNQNTDNNSYPDPQNGLSSINPSDVESIQVLKDASATAIYGSRGANGVVLITTKRGRTEKGVITFSMSTEISKRAKKIDILNGPNYVAFENEL
jgi:TonB-dependent SusC/RagA subfamily outer membrane receptor